MTKPILTTHQKLIRQSVRDFLLTATLDELREELRLSIDERNDLFRASCVTELIQEKF